MRLAIFSLLIVASVSCNQVSESEDSKPASQKPPQDTRKPALETDITGYGSYSFGQPLPKESGDTWLSKKGNDFNLYMSLEGEDFKMPHFDFSVNATMSFATLEPQAENAIAGDAETIESIIFKFNLADLIRSAKSEAPSSLTIAEFFHETFLKKYDLQIVETNIKTNEKIYLFLRDADNDTIWLDFMEGDGDNEAKLDIGYKSAAIREVTDKMQVEQEKAIEKF